MFTLKEIVQATGGKLFHAFKIRKIKGVSTNSRTLKKGELFIAIQGQKFDAHHFIPNVIEAGASAVVISKKEFIPKIEIPTVLVADTTKALGNIASFHRQRFKIPVVAITGSAGKTTTKEMIAAVLQTQYKVLKNFKTENNQFGVPLTLLQLRKSHEIVVMEIGTNHFGDIRWLTQVLQPTVAIFTNIGESHLEFLKNPAGVFREKSDLIRYQSLRGHIIFNSDDEQLKKIYFLNPIPEISYKEELLGMRPVVINKNLEMI